MRRFARLGLGAAAAAVLAVTGAIPGSGSARAAAPIVGGSNTAAAHGSSATVTLVTGDRVEVDTDAQGRRSVMVLPREDGSEPIVQTRQLGQDLYVYPESAEAALAAGMVDEQLFNVSGLIRQGYDDAHRDSIPLIATYGADLARARSLPAVPQGATRGLTLDSVDGVALSADKHQAVAFWQSVTGARLARSSAFPLKKLWLDRKVQATDAASVQQVDAVAAWSQGYDGSGSTVAVLDTGVDAGHPDLAGRIAGSKDFTGDGVDDGNGHGTHTASTVAGTGASDGRTRGVAPGAELLIGKVLDNSGAGDASWIIAGMQWAVAQGADVVSMSLGSTEASDCTDPMAAAAQELASSGRTLFVIAAGNTGPHDGTIGSPGCAPAVLTVGAVDRDDSTASFSSRGPVLTAHTLKPEIAAPGVAISAARAGGRGVYAYQSMSGTSMATPHVAGGAAILHEAHPDWTGQQLKEALVASARTGGQVGDAGQVGAGVLDVDAAVHQSVSSVPSVNGGDFAWPHTVAQRTTVQVPVTNSGTEAVRLHLRLDGVDGNDGSAVRGDAVRIGGARTVAVPAGATVDVPLALDPAAPLTDAQYGAVSGRLEATGDDGQRLSVPFGFFVEPETVTLTVKLLDRNGRPATGASTVDVTNTDTATASRTANAGADEQVFRLRPGSYTVSSFVVGYDTAGGAATDVSYLAEPQLRLRGDLTLTLDARQAHRISFATPRPATVSRSYLSYGRWWDDTWTMYNTLSAGPAVTAFYADILDQVRDGGYEFRLSQRALGSDADGSYVYNLTHALSGPVRRDTVWTVGGGDLARVDETWNALGAAGKYRDLLALLPAWAQGGLAYSVGAFDPVTVPGTRTAYYSTGDEQWWHSAQTPSVWAAVLDDRYRSYPKPAVTGEEWYRGLMAPQAPQDENGKPVLVAERQGELIGFQDAFWGDASGSHWSYGGSFGDFGNLRLSRDGEEIGSSAWPFGVFTVPADDSRYTLEQQLLKFPSSDRAWQRSMEIDTAWTFRSHLEPDVYSRALPILFPHYDVPLDGLNTVAPGVARIGLSVTGHAGYTPGGLSAAALEYSYDGGTTWQSATVQEQGGSWTAVLDHTGAAGKQVTLRTTLTDADGASVTQTVIRAYDVRAAQ